MDSKIKSDPSDVESNGRKSRGGGFDGPTDEKCAEYVKKLISERDALNPERFPVIFELIQKELDQMAKGANGIVQDNGYVDLYNDTPITLYVKAVPPSKIFPKFNYAGRIIGPKGTYLKALMKETMTKMILLGKGVMKDKDKEASLRRGSDPKYYHLHEDMHVAIQVTAPAAEAYARVAYALKCLKQQVLSDNRGLEDLPWISSTTRYLEGGDQSAPTKRHHSPPPPIQSSRQSSSRSSYVQRTSYADYPEEPYQYSYDYPREPSPSPGHSSKAPYYSSSSYGVSSRRPPPQPESSTRAMDYVDKVRTLRPHTTSHGTRASSPGMRPSYDYGHGSNTSVYEQDPAPTSHHYFDPDARSSSWSTSELYQSKPSMDRSGRSTGWSGSTQSRYAPYSKK